MDALDSHFVDSLLASPEIRKATESPELIETHISWVILAGDVVYKIKKPVKLDFLDFREPGKRRFYCEEELRLNRYWAPEIYRDVIPITLHDGNARLAGSGKPVDYAVRMRRFDQRKLLTEELARGTLTAEDMRQLGAHIAERHLAATVVDAKQRERYLRKTLQFIRDNFTALEQSVAEQDLLPVRDWSEQQIAMLEPLLRKRFDRGLVRNCHGDLHLRNLVRLPDGIRAFDCIEFDADLRHIDVFCDIAFLLIDLVSRKRHDLAAHFLDRYLERTGDYEGMAVFSLFFVYRCLVRAKVAAIRLSERRREKDRSADRADMDHYVNMANRQIAARRPILVVMSGLSGSGKTWVSEKLVGGLPAIRVRADIERKRLFGLDEVERSESDIGAGIYTAESSQKVYRRLTAIAGSMLEHQHNVILDAAFLDRSERARAIDVATAGGHFSVTVVVTAPIEVLRRRLRKRAELAADVSEADVDVLNHQLTIAEAVEENEGSLVVRIENTGETDLDDVVAHIKLAARQHSAANEC